jgi:hypothetical protein
VRRIDFRLEASRAQQLARPLGDFRRARRRVLNLVQGCRESAEIVDRLRLRAAGQCGPLGLPVRGGDEDRARARQALAQRRPGAAGRRGAGFERVHRRAVRDEDGGQ